jgi:sulfatase modifying factor 1
MNASSPHPSPHRRRGGWRDIARLVTAACLTLAAVVSSSAPTHAVTIDWVTVGDPGNAADTTGYGAVAESYRIGKYEVTIGQYADFLNAAAKSDPYSLYNTSMASDLSIAGISRAGSSGSYTYSVIGPSGSTPAGASSPTNRPIAFVSWFDAARFANWMHNGQGSGSTETGAYTLVGGQTSGMAPAKNPDAQFYIPTEDEWYKAAYYKGSGTSAGYWNYATQSDTAPGNTIGSGANQANYYSYGYAVTQSSIYSATQNYLTDVGAFSNSVSAYGTFDQTGNVFEWNDLTGAGDSARGLRGGNWYDSAVYLSSSYRGVLAPSYTLLNVGFRLASPVASGVPEIDPAGFGSVAALLTGALGLLERRRKR